MLNLKTLWHSAIPRGRQYTRNTMGFISKTVKSVKSKVRALWYSARHWFIKHTWLSKKALWYLASILTAIALLYGMLPYTIYRHPGVIEMMVNTLNLIPFVHIDMAEAYTNLHIWIGRAFDVVLFAFVIFVVLFIRQAIMDIKKGRPELQTSEHTQPLSIESVKQLIIALNSVSEALTKYINQQDGETKRGKDGK